MNVKKLAEESWEGCDSCTEQDEIMYKNGYVKGYNAATAELSKEILEEAAEKYANELPEPYNYGINSDKKKGFIEGAKWYREQLKKKQL